MPAPKGKKPLSSDEALAKLDVRQRRFVEAYCTDFNATQSAIKAGYSKKESSAATIGWRLLRIVEIKAAIAAVCEELSMTSGEAFKHITDIATTRLQDYMVIREVERTPKVRKSLRVLIDEIRATIELEEEYHQKANLTDKEQVLHLQNQIERQNQIIRYELELARNPEAFRTVSGDPELVERAEINLVALAKAKGQGRIKSLSFTEFGPKVELESAASALDKIMQLHGRYVQKLEVNDTGSTIVRMDPITKTVIIEDVEEDD